MRKYFAIAVGCAFLLFVVAAMAQTSGSSGQYGSQSTSTSRTETQSSTTQSSTSSQPSTGQQTIEGCVIKEGTDFFLVPKSGNPIQLQASGAGDISEHAGHKVKVTGSETAMSTSPSGSSTGMAGSTGAATSASGASSQAQSQAPGAMGAPTGSTSAQGSSGMATGTGNDLHRLADQQMTVTKVQHTASSCPVNWNPNVPTPSSPSSENPSRY